MQYWRKPFLRDEEKETFAWLKLLTLIINCIAPYHMLDFITNLFKEIFIFTNRTYWEMR